MTWDLSLLAQNPEFTCRAILKVEALAPLSMVVKLPGKYYRSQPAPSEIMLMAMLENALGWHIADKERNELLKKLKAKHKSEAPRSGVGFGSLLSWHVRFPGPNLLPEVMHYDDLWAQHLRGSSFPSGSRNYDASAIPLMDAAKANRVTISDTADAKRGDGLLQSFEDGDKINMAVLRSHFPQYYASPTPREFVEPKGAYLYIIESSSKIMEMLSNAIGDPAAPLYLGSSEGWIEASLEGIQ